MLEKLKRISANLKALDFEQTILDTVKDTESVLIDISTSQLMQGEDGNENPIEPFYKSVNYAEYKLSLNPLGVVDLNNTGSFHGSFFVRVDKFPISIFATDEKVYDLVDNYGEEIFEIQVDNKDAYSKDYILPVLQEKLLQAVHV